MVDLQVLGACLLYVVTSGTGWCTHRQWIGIPPICVWCPSLGCSQRSPQPAWEMIMNVQWGPHRLSAVEQGRNPKITFVFRRNLNFFMVELTILLAISKDIFEAFIFESTFTNTCQLQAAEVCSLKGLGFSEVYKLCFSRGKVATHNHTALWSCNATIPQDAVK